jgi:hypothetical protein
LVFFRINSSAEDIFAYEGNKLEEEALYDACKEQDLCMCEYGGIHECNTIAAANACSPPQQITNTTETAGGKI